jgi:diguanylate cyclase (GGDEF)-like protein
VVRLLGGLGSIAPLALVLLAVATLNAGADGSDAQRWAVVAIGAAVLTGASVVALAAWLHMRLRIEPAIRAAERLAAGEDAAPPAVAPGPDGRLTRAVERLVGVVADARRAASVDRLTAVATRGSILATLASEVDRATRYDRPLSIAFIDIDRFKSVNDTFGHEVGDAVLHLVAQAIRGSLRSTDAVGRYGGEEFLVVLPETGIDEAATISEKLRASVERTAAPTADGASVAVTISVGIAGGRGRILAADALLRSADAAMYAAKALGRNQVSVDVEADDDVPIASAPISPAGRDRARAVGQSARRAAEEALVAFAERLPVGGGRPSPAVVTIADGLARAFGLSEPEVDRIRLAAILRDVGKVAVPLEILAKEGPLTGPEWQLVAQHPRIGQAILEQSSALRDVAPLVLHHHERWGGHGYPYGLRGREIPLGSRIVAIADAYDGMTAPRPHRRPADPSEALAELRRRAGTQFDPELVRLFEDLFGAGVPVPPPTVVRRREPSGIAVPA